MQFHELRSVSAGVTDAGAGAPWGARRREERIDVGISAPNRVRLYLYGKLADAELPKGDLRRLSVCHALAG